MRAAFVIAGREVRSLLALPVGWVVIALYALIAGVVFRAYTLAPGEPATMRSFFNLSAFLMPLVAPAISMRLFSEEYRSRTIEPLMTAPLSDAALVLGKFLGGAAFLTLMLLPTAALPVVLVLSSDPAPDPGPILAGYACLVLVGMLYVAVGLVASALTSNQTLAFLAALMVIVALSVGTTLLPDRAPPAVARVLHAASIGRRAADFSRGLIDTGHVVFFLAWTAWLLVAAYAALVSRRWR